MTNEKLIDFAEKAREKAYAPYSGFKVGAALLTDSNEVYLGCNIENAAYGETVCAERTALFKAVSEGNKNFVKIAVVGGKKGENSVPAYPCGACRQVMAEFCKENFVILVKDGDEIKEYLLKDLLPFSFNNTVLLVSEEQKYENVRYNQEKT